MKNIFKLMGLALIAGSMFVACSKDDDDAAIKVTFDGDSWTTNANMKVVPTNGNNAEFSIYQNAEDRYASAKFSCPMAIGKHMFTNTDNWVVYWDGDDDDADEYNNTSLDGFIDLTNFDATNKKVSGNINATFIDGEDQLPFSVTMNDASFVFNVL